MKIQYTHSLDKATEMYEVWFILLDFFISVFFTRFIFLGNVWHVQKFVWNSE